MFALPIGLGPMAVRDGLGEVLREVAHRPVRVGRAGEHAPGVDLDSEPGHVRRLLDRVRRLIPGRQRFARLRVDVHLPVGVPGREDAVVDDPVALRPPHLVVGRGGDLPQFDPGYRPPHRKVQVRPSRRCGSTAARYCTSQPTNRRKFCTNRSTGREKCRASLAART